jgi:hypothetical protein
VVAVAVALQTPPAIVLTELWELAVGVEGEAMQEMQEVIHQHLVEQQQTLQLLTAYL